MADDPAIAGWGPLVEAIDDNVSKPQPATDRPEQLGGALVCVLRVDRGDVDDQVLGFGGADGVFFHLVPRRRQPGSSVWSLPLLLRLSRHSRLVCSAVISAPRSGQGENSGKRGRRSGATDGFALRCQGASCRSTSPGRTSHQGQHADKPTQLTRWRPAVGSELRLASTGGPPWLCRLRFRASIAAVVMRCLGRM